MSAIEAWLEIVPERPQTQLERDLMLTVRDLLMRMPQVPSPADLEAAARALRCMARYSRSREAQGARIEAHLAALRETARQPLARPS